ncbi:WXG100 family type VII secretion target [Saccharopolyspora sp. ASAGF58]|uniref:WXG100 family type VII secretion target n=1 Tax=Saccharopolyspora sp. ASAGF58 TaxID=2719023 RepID=UPI00144771CA|nr:WXG100 family type VII secretion target [Saccharopolyspora sp. ASAGF58]
MARNSSEVAEHLDYLSRIADELEVANSIPADLADLVGRHEELREAARVWREGAENLENAAAHVQGRLGGIDSAWQGQDADAFLAHVQDVGLAGNDLVDTMRALADVLDHTVEALQAQLDDLGGLVAEAADSVSAALLAPEGGAKRARQHLAELAQPASELAESISDTYRAFARFCDDVEAGRSAGSVQFDHRMPAQAWDFNAPTPAHPLAQPALAEPAGAESAGGGAGGVGAVGGGAAAAGVSGAPGGGAAAAGVSGGPGGGAEHPLSPGDTTRAGEPSAVPPAAAAAGGAVAGAAGGVAAGGMMGGMMPMGMMGGMMGGAQGAGQDRKNQSRLKSKPEELFGTPPDAAPAVLGESSRDRDQDQERPAATTRQSTRRLGVPSIIEPPTPRSSIADALHPKQTAEDTPKPKTGTASVGDAPPPKPKTGTASVGDAPPPKPKTGTASVGDAPPPKPKTGTASVGDAPPPKRRN